MDVETVFPDEQARLNRPFDFTHLFQKVADDPSTASSATGILPISSSATVFVPVFPLPQSMTLAEVMRIVERTPSVLRKFQMRFDSAVATDRKTGKVVSITDHCEYVFDAPPPISIALINSLGLRFADKELQPAVFRSSRPHLMSDWGGRESRIPGGEFSFGGSRSQPNIPSGRLVKQQTIMEIVISGDVVLASVPITFYKDRDENH